ncbi:MAG: DeoR family transcriptional regulator [Clostridia bacterium]|nr:DeoR family transcriptional regulator [Clostridia bacterium]
METTERRTGILKVLCRRRHEIIENLASEFNVSERTIRRDIAILSISYPIYTQSGKYRGGVYMIDGFYLDRMYMSEAELEVMKKLYAMIENGQTELSQSEKETFKSLIALYSKPTKKITKKEKEKN